MKTCSKCKVCKDSSEFYKNKHQLDGLWRYCILCDTIRIKNYRLENPEKITEQRRAYKNKQRRKHIDLLKGSKCSYCGYDKHIAPLQFHHIWDKSFNISTAIHEKSEVSIQKEKEKCIILCANCHAIETSKQMWRYKNT